ncbi:MAG: calcium-binding protein, partial [Burkholderiales bacterium]|nr:calcium-binding protein [Burkholderiales bacterium]
MSLFIGSNAGEIITPGFVSPSVKVIGSPNKPSAAVDFIFAGGGDDVVEGGAGNDFAFLGAGNDKFTWKPGDGSDFVDGGKGDDTLAFDGANINETINISSSVHGLASFTRDAANITMTLNKVERIEFNALGGQDRITLKDLGGTDVEEVAIDLGGILGAAGGDGQVDQVIAEATNGADTIEVLAGGTSASVAGLAASLTIADLEAADQLMING